MRTQSRLTDGSVVLTGKASLECMHVQNSLHQGFTLLVQNNPPTLRECSSRLTDGGVLAGAASVECEHVERGTGGAFGPAAHPRSESEQACQLQRPAPCSAASLRAVKRHVPLACNRAVPLRPSPHAATLHAPGMCCFLAFCFYDYVRPNTTLRSHATSEHHFAPTLMLHSFLLSGSVLSFFFLVCF